jgi:putative oxidoreductase
MIDLGLLFLRVVAGAMMLGHGYGKVVDFFSGSTGFPDPLGIGSRASLASAAFGEFVCTLLVLVGVKTRLAAIPVLGTMLVAAFVFHAADPFAEKELALLYAAAFATLALTGGGAWSVDGLLAKRKGGKRRRR